MVVRMSRSPSRSQSTVVRPRPSSSKSNPEAAELTALYARGQEHSREGDRAPGLVALELVAPQGLTLVAGDQLRADRHSSFGADTTAQ